MTITNQSANSYAYSDVLIVGAGLSGIGAAYRIQEQNPDLSYTILERRARVGGTWDLFQYPGVRSDSDIFTLSFPWRPWTRSETIARGSDIRAYIADSAHEHGIDRHIEFDTTVLAANWDWTCDTWTVTARRDGRDHHYRCRFIFFGTGYYSYDRPYTPDLPGAESFCGTIIHPQHWPEGFDYSGKRVVGVGNGATAVSMIPTLTETAGDVTLLQRSPGYVVSQREHNSINNAIRAALPSRAAHAAVRWWNVALGTSTFAFARKAPKLTRRWVRRLAKAQLPAHFDVDTHFNPKYHPWDQRVCVSLDGDLYTTIRQGRLNVVTDHIERLDARGIVLRSGTHLDADVIVTATGFQLELLGAVKVSIGDQQIKPHEHWSYKTHLLNDVPNLAWCIGYTNVSWTLRADTTARYVAKLLAYMDSHRYTHAYPHLENADAMATRPAFDLRSGYVLRSPNVLPKSGDRQPWQVRQNFLLDMLAFRRNRIDECMVFSRIDDRPRFPQAMCERSES